MTKIDPKTVAEKYDEVSCLETHQERREFLGKQETEMKAALWLENIDRKTSEIKLSAEQKEILGMIKKKFINAEFIESARGKSEEQAGPEYDEAMSRANELLGKDMMRELFVVLGDNSTLKTLY